MAEQASSILLITERPEQITGGGCCGRLEGDLHLLGCHEELFPIARERQNAFAIVQEHIRSLADKHGWEVEIVPVDPRNQLYLWCRLIRDVLRFRPGFVAGLRAVCLWFGLPAIVVNGKVVAERTVDPACLCSAVENALRRHHCAAPP